MIKLGNWWFLGKNTIGLTFWPFIFLKKSYFDKAGKAALQTTINHEKIHIRQQAELLVIPFYIWYFLEFFIKSWSTSTIDDAYRSISFEREAYQNQDNPDYLKTRKFWSFLKYL